MRRAFRLALCLCVALVGAVAGGGVAAPAAAQGVSAGLRWTDTPLEEALVEFARAAGVDIVFAHRLVEGRRVTAQWRRGDDPAGTLAALLAGTGLRAERLRARQFVVIVEPPNVIVEPDDPAAYTGVMEGVIVDAATGEPLLGAHAYLVDLGLGGVAKEDGSFTVPGIPTGEYVVRFSHVGYRATSVTLAVYPEAPQLPPTIRLRPEAVELGAAVARPSSDPSAGSGATDLPPAGSIGARQAAALPPDAGGDLLRVLDWLPGLSRAPGAGGLVVRGADPALLRTVRDGVPVYAAAHAAGLAGAFQPEALRGVRLHRGTPPADVGGGLAGVLEVEPRDGRGERASGVAGLGPVAARAVVVVPLSERVGVAASARHSALGWPVRGWPYAPALHRADGALVLDPLGGPLRHGGDGAAVGYGFADGEATLTWAPNPRNRLSVSGWAAGDRLDSPDGDALAARGRWVSSLGALRYRVLSGRTFVTATLYSTGADATEQVGTDTTGLWLRYFSSVLQESGVRVEADRFLSLAHTLRLGVHLARREATALLDVGGRTSEAAGRAAEAAVWAQDVWKPDGAVQVEAGLRAEAFGPRVRLSPRVLARWAAQPERLYLRAGLGRQTQGLHRLPDGPYGAPERASARWLLAGAAVAPASAWQAGAGAEWAPLLGLALSADAYGRLSTGTWELRPGAAPDAARLDSVGASYAPTRGRAAGLELAARAEGGPWVIGLSYALARAETRTPPAVGADAPGPWRAARYDRPHALGLLVERAGRHWSASARLDLLAGFPDGVGGRMPAQARLELAVGYAFRALGAHWDLQARAQPTAARRVFPSAELSTPAPLALAADGATLPAWPVVSLRAAW